jgi:hypothetical protein
MLFVALLPNVLNSIIGVHPLSFEKWSVFSINHIIFFSSPFVQRWITTVSITLIPPVIYLSVFRNRDKTAAIIAGLFCAGSIYLVRSADEAPITALFTLLIAVTYAFVNFDLAIPAALLLVIAGSLRPEGALFAISVLICLAVRRDKRIIPVCVIYLLGTVAFAITLHSHHLLVLDFIRSRAAIPWAAAWTQTPSFATSWWFLFPFLGDLSNTEARKRHAPLLLFLAAYFTLLCAVVHPHSAQSLLPAMPFLYLLIGVGMSRVIPIIAGEIRGVALRFAVAIIATFVIIAICFAQQWHQLKLSTAPNTYLTPAVNHNSATAPVILQRSTTTAPTPMAIKPAVPGTSPVTTVMTNAAQAHAPATKSIEVKSTVPVTASMKPAAVKTAAAASSSAKSAVTKVVLVTPKFVKPTTAKAAITKPVSAKPILVKPAIPKTLPYKSKPVNFVVTKQIPAMPMYAKPVAQKQSANTAHPAAAIKPLTIQKSEVAQAALSKSKTQGEDSNESRSNGWRRGNTAAAAHFKPAKAVSAHPKQTVHAALYRAPKAVWRGRNNSYSLLPGG